MRPKEYYDTFDLIFTKRSTQIVNGNALVARLLKSAFDYKVKLLANHAMTELVEENGRVIGALFKTPAGIVKIIAKHGVVLATGGFPHDEKRKQALFKHVSEGTPHHSAAPETNIGDGLIAAEAIGATVDQTLPWSGAWAPVSLIPRLDGTLGRFPHLVERGKPGLIAVLKMAVGSRMKVIPILHLLKIYSNIHRKANKHIAG